jgi:ABC-type sugar transport system ATPase subunit
MVFQDYALYPHMTVAKNMGLPLKRAGVPTEEVRANVQKTTASGSRAELAD